MASEATIQRGPWMNWTKGPIFGGTITMSVRDGPLLVAFIALFVRLAGSHFWSIFCYAVHQWRSKRGQRDGLHHQQQATLRNSSSVASTLWLWLIVGNAWRSHTNHPLWRSLALIVAAVSHIVIFAVAGIFSSHITITGDQNALVRSPYCGAWPVDLEILSTNFNNLENTPTNILDEESTYAINTRQELTSSLAYARNCYELDSLQCQAYIVPYLPQKIDNTSSCPFDESICTTDAIEIDTGLIDSALHLGINARSEDRVWYRRTTSCAVLSQDGYTTSVVGPRADDSAYPYQNETFFFYGKDVYGHNYTTSFSNYTYNGLYAFWYDLGSVSSLQDFTPIPALNRDDADTDILFLMTELQYLHPVDDPWFSAHTNVADPGQAPLYVADNNPAPLGCINQHQFCNPNLPVDSQCTSLTRLGLAINQSQSELNFNPTQNATFTRLLNAAFTASFNRIAIALDNDIFDASQYVAENKAISLPDDQWQFEVVNLNSIMLAYMQRLMVSYAEGPNSVDYYRYIVQPSTPEEQQMCENQIISDGYHYHFSILGIALILALGGLIIFLNLTLEPLVRLMRNRRQNDNGLYKQLEWDMTETLQLQRLVYEGQGSGTWHGAPDATPVTSYGDRFGIPEWTGMGEAKRISLGGTSSLDKAGSPLMKSEAKSTLTEIVG